MESRVQVVYAPSPAEFDVVDFSNAMNADENTIQQGQSPISPSKPFDLVRADPHGARS